MARGKKRNPDNLDGSTGNIFFSIYTFPGKVFLWLEYMNPKGGFTGVAKSSRRAKSPIFTILISTAFWFCILLFIFSILNPKT